jgi:hypothetical protein
LADAWALRGRTHPQLQALAAFLLRERHPEAVECWLRTLAPAVRRYLETVRQGASITAAGLAPLTALKGGRSLLLSCRRAGILPPLDTARLERIVARLAAKLPHAHALVLRQYWQFERAPRIAARPYQLRRIDRHLACDARTIYAVGRFLAALGAARVPVANLTQDRVDEFVLGKSRGVTATIAQFCRWLRESGRLHRPLHVRCAPCSVPRGCARGECLATLDAARTNSALPLDVRVALLFTVLCDQPLRRIVTVHRRALQRRNGILAVRFGAGVVWPFEGAEAALVEALAARSRGWLFPSPCCYGQPLSARTLGQRIHQARFASSAAELRTAAVREMLREYDPLEVARATGHGGSWAARWRQQRDAVDVETKHQLARLRWNPVS